jgi:hypothetical protein
MISLDCIAIAQALINPSRYHVPIPSITDCLATQSGAILLPALYLAYLAYVGRTEGQIPYESFFAALCIKFPSYIDTSYHLAYLKLK